ncbi:MAG: hypothetical protein RLP14_07125 [Owenweeksia sp.]
MPQKINLPSLEGDKTHPPFNYTFIERKGETQLLDEVKYLKKGKEKAIMGYDVISSKTELSEAEKAER